MSISKKNAKSLATAYQAYIEGVNAFNDNAIAVWGPILLRAQEATGVVMQSPDLIQRMGAGASARLAASGLRDYSPAEEESARRLGL